MFEKVLIPIDWSISSDEVSSEILFNIVDKFSADVYFLHVIEIITAPPFKKGRDIEEEQLRKNTKERFNEFEKKILGKLKDNINCKFFIRVGKPAEEICKFSEEENVSLIAMASHGYTGFKKYALGSVAYAVSHRTKKPLLLLPRIK